jgi:hypothetical protein
LNDENDVFIRIVLYKACFDGNVIGDIMFRSVKTKGTFLDRILEYMHNLFAHSPILVSTYFMQLSPESC